MCKRGDGFTLEEVVNVEREKKFGLINELSKAVTDKTVYEHELSKGRVEYVANTRTLKINKDVAFSQETETQEIEHETEEELFARIYEQRKNESQKK